MKVRQGGEGGGREVWNVWGLVAGRWFAVGEARGPGEWGREVSQGVRAGL
jgi:hypothetical protein